MALKHLKKLYPSNEGHIQFIEAIVNRVCDLKDAYLRIRGTVLQLPADMEKDAARFSTLVGRYSQGDYRHSRIEMDSAKSVAQWSVDVNCDIRNSPRKEIQWMEESQS